MTDDRQITYKSELLRKGIHLMSLSIPFLYAILSKGQALWLLVPVTLVFVVIDIVSHRSGRIRTLLIRYFGELMRSHELQLDRLHLNGASYVLIAACMCVIVFPKLLAITSFSILIVSDICAALVGRRFGKHRFLDKSLEGTIAFAVSAILVVIVISVHFGLPSSFFVLGLIGSFVGALVENISPRLHLDDNISIPFSIGVAMWVLAPLIDPALFVLL